MVESTPSTDNSTILSIRVFNSSNATITWNPNGGYWNNNTSDTQSQTEQYEYEASINQNTQTLKRDGYSFLGWGTSADATTAVTNFGIAESDTTYFAIWSKDTYIVKFNKNTTDTVDNLPAQLEPAVNTPVEVTGLPTRYGYYLLGWTTTSGGTTPDSRITVANGKTTFNGLGTNGETINLYAIWRAWLSLELPIDVTMTFAAPLPIDTTKDLVLGNTPEYTYTIKNHSVVPIKITNIKVDPLSTDMSLWSSAAPSTKIWFNNQLGLNLDSTTSDVSTLTGATNIAAAPSKTASTPYPITYAIKVNKSALPQLDSALLALKDDTSAHSFTKVTYTVEKLHD